MKIKSLLNIALMYFSSLCVNGQDNLGNHIAMQDILPVTDNALKLGSATKRFKDVHISGALYWGDPTTPGISNRIFSANNTGGIFIGRGAGTSGIDNVFLGNFSGSLATSSSNTFIGTSSGQNTTSGGSNTFIGNFSGVSNTVGSENTFLGKYAGRSSESGIRNVYIGAFAADNNSSGDKNTVVGSYAGTQASGYNSGTFIGSNASAIQPNLTNVAAIGANATVNVSNGFVLGNNLSNVGIRQISPQYPLHIIKAFCDGFTWTNGSDKNSKENFRSLEFENILDKVIALPIQRWNYIEDVSRSSHIGPMAQDFYKTFNVGKNETSISTVDESGIALAAIQELGKRLLKIEKTMEDQQQLIAALLTSMSQKKEEVNASGLDQNAPNPITHTTTIRYHLADNSSGAVIRVVDQSGRQMVSFSNLLNGHHEINLDTASLDSGVYFYILTVNGKVIDAKKMIKLN